jgi:hypothetical protein
MHDLRLRAEFRGENWWVGIEGPGISIQWPSTERVQELWRETVGIGELTFAERPQLFAAYRLCRLPRRTTPQDRQPFLEALQAECTVLSGSTDMVQR